MRAMTQMLFTASAGRSIIRGKHLEPFRASRVYFECIMSNIVVNCSHQSNCYRSLWSGRAGQYGLNSNCCIISNIDTMLHILPEILHVTLKCNFKCTVLIR